MRKLGYNFDVLKEQHSTPNENILKNIDMVLLPNLYAYSVIKTSQS